MTDTASGPGFSPMQTELSKAAFPMIFGEPSTVDGYCSLERGERDNSQETLDQHRYEATLWYRGIKLLVDPFEGEWEVPDDEPARSAQITRGSLLGLEVSSAKAALDMTLAGYYSMAFAGIRHMLEATAQIIYILLFPDEHIEWQPERAAPQMRQIIDQIKKELKKRAIPPDRAERFEELYKSWKLMCSGSHPSGSGLIQVQPTVEDPRSIVGAVYRPNFSYVAFDHGLWALQMLIMVHPTLGRGDAEWGQSFNVWSSDRQKLRAHLRSREDLQWLWEAEASEEQILEATDSEIDESV